MNTQSELRIGDAEREAAASALAEHFAAGRLTREEYDERSDQVWTAKTNSDLLPLFTDLPSPRMAHPRGGRTAAPGHSGRGSSALHHGRSTRGWRWRRVPFFPGLLLAVVLLIALPGFPWLLFGLAWLWFAGCFCVRRPGWQQSGDEGRA